MSSSLEIPRVLSLRTTAGHLPNTADALDDAVAIDNTSRCDQEAAS